MIRLFKSHKPRTDMFVYYKAHMHTHLNTYTYIYIHDYMSRDHTQANMCTTCKRSNKISHPIVRKIKRNIPIIGTNRINLEKYLYCHRYMSFRLLCDRKQVFIVLKNFQQILNICVLDRHWIKFYKTASSLRKIVVTILKSYHQPCELHRSLVWQTCLYISIPNPHRIVMQIRNIPIFLV